MLCLRYDGQCWHYKCVNYDHAGGCEDCERWSNAATARPLILVRRSEIWTYNWLNTNKQLEKVVSNHIAERHLQMNHRIDQGSAKYITYSINYYQQHTLESWCTIK